MALEILTFTLGPLDNNAYLLADPINRTAVLIDPSFDTQEIIQFLARQEWMLTAIWITHAHFDHIAGIHEILANTKSHPAIALHPLDLPLWQSGGGAGMFGFSLGKLPDPDNMLHHGQEISFGSEFIHVRHTPGHSAGHVVFYISTLQTLFCGDVIFFHGIGRTDLPAGDPDQLTHSIRNQIYTLPAQTRLLSGHGPASTVGEEIANNPYVRP